MMRIRGHLTYANVMATAAVFIALGGSSYAAVKLADNSVKSKHIANGQVKRADLAANAVDSSRVKDGALRKRDFAGPLDADRLGGLTADAFQRRGGSTTCPAGQKVTGLGAGGDVTCAADPAIDTSAFVQGGGRMISREAEVTGVPAGTSQEANLIAESGLRIALNCRNEVIDPGAAPVIENTSSGPMELWIDPSSGSPLYGSMPAGEDSANFFNEDFVDEVPQSMVYQGTVGGKAFTAFVMTTQVDELVPGTCRANARVFLAG